MKGQNWVGSWGKWCCLEGGFGFDIVVVVMGLGFVLGHLAIKGCDNGRKWRNEGKVFDELWRWRRREWESEWGLLGVCCCYKKRVDRWVHIEGGSETGKLRERERVSQPNLYFSTKKGHSFFVCSNLF